MAKFSSTVALLAIAFVLDANQQAWPQSSWSTSDPRHHHHHRGSSTASTGGGSSTTTANSGGSSTNTSGGGSSGGGSSTTATSAGTGRVFYVSNTGRDSNSGAIGSPWRTIGRAVKTMVAGDTTIVEDGTYSEPSIEFDVDGTVDKPITLRARNKWKAILSSTSGCAPNISVAASYIVIEDLRSSISPSNSPCWEHNSADGAAVRCWEKSVPTASQPSTGRQGCTVRGILVDPSPARSVGIKTNQDYSLIENSVVHASIEAFNNRGTIIRNNFVDTGDAWGDRVYGKGGVRDLQIYNNEVHVRGDGRGLFVGGNSSCCWFDLNTHIEAYNSVAFNNVIVSDGGAASPLLLGMVGAQDSALVNNVVIDGSMFFERGAAEGYDPRPPSINPIIQNNISSCGGRFVMSLDSTSISTISAIDYNNFFECTSIPIQNHPVVGDPLFMNRRSDWHLKSGSPALRSGSKLFFRSFEGKIIDLSHNRDGIVRTLPWNLGVY